MYYAILLAVGLMALTGIIVSFLGMAGRLPNRQSAGSEEWDNPFFVSLIVSLAVFGLDAALAGLAWVWEHDPSHIAALTLTALLLVIIGKWGCIVYGTSLLGLWRKLAPAPAAAPPKKPWFSKTIVLNGLVAAGLLAEAKLPFLQGLLPASKYQIVAFVLPMVNMVLRAYTTQGLSLKSILPSTEASQ